MAYHEDWVGNPYENKEEVIQGIIDYFENADGFENVCECGKTTMQKIFEHFTAIFSELDDSTVKKIMDVQDKLFCVDD
jgi:hypothetical protein